MSRFHSYINSAAEILRLYNGEEPFSSFLKKYFTANKKFGSKDRKQVSHLCYCFFRLGKMSKQVSVEDRLLIGLFLCANEPNDLIETFRPEWNNVVAKNLKEKFSFLNAQFFVQDVFPWRDELSGGIDYENFRESFFIQPDLFLRLRPGQEELVKKKLNDAGLDFKMVGNNCLALPNASKIDSIIEVNKDAVVQDISSQRIGEFFQLAIPGSQPARQAKVTRVWDCCAASGGKSILLYDQLPGVDLTVSDVRESILANLKKRFKEADIKKYNSVVADLAAPQFKFPFSNFEFIVCDVPCSGSGTWSRTPEQLYYFEKDKIAPYASLQKKIVSNVIPHLAIGGHLLYITCSVFKQENEELVEFIKQNFHFQLITMKILKGYGKKADTMFAALLKKSL